MPKHISFPSIEQFRNIVANVNREYNFVGLDEQGEAIYDLTKPKPILTFTGTVKLHGTNMGVCYNDQDGMWVQSRENIITPDSDNAGAAFFVKTHETAFKYLFGEVKEVYKIDTSINTISIYAEWVGKGIQKGIAIGNLPKSMFIFGLKISPHPKDADDKVTAYWLNHDFLSSPEDQIYNIEDYKMYAVDIDFNNPQAVQNKIIEMTIEVENECPVAKAFGFEGIGEGIVFAHMTDNGKVYRFKSKGEKHAQSSKVKILKPVDDVKLNKVITVTNLVTPDWRLEQALDKTFDLMNGGSLDVKKLGDYIKNVIADIVKEELDVIAENELELKDLTSKISERSRNFFFAKQNEAVGLS